METVNTLTHPEGAEYTFQAGEGIYVLRDELQLATPPPHPSENVVTTTNPLATTVVPPTSGVKMSILTLNQRQVRPELYKTTTATSSLLRWRTMGMGRQENKSSKDSREVEKDHKLLADAASEESVTMASTTSTSNKSSQMHVFGENNAALTPVTTRETVRRRKPKNNIIKSNSSFVSRVIPHDHLSKRLSERDSGASFVFLNINRAFQWLDLSSSMKPEPLTKILFTKAHMLCHDVNQLTKDATHIDVIMGSSASDIIWYEPVSQKYARINKNGIINGTPVLYIKWIPGSENLFVAAHMDGALVVYDKEKDDAPFLPETVDDANSATDVDTQLNILKSVNSPNQKTNPVSYWKVSTQSIHELAFSPDGRHLAVVGEDMYLRVVDYLQERLTDLYAAYYGGIMCVCWSPDGKYILTGGQDDLVTIWSLAERQIVARCSGHGSWVTAVAFDPWRCDDKTYRFASVGADCRLLLWDFNLGMLHRPKGPTTRTRGSVSGQSVSLIRQPTGSTSVINRVRSDSTRTQSVAQELDEDAEFMKHAVEPDKRTAKLPPIMSKAVDSHPVTGLVFEQDCIITSCREGHVRTWNRPPDGVNGSQINVSTTASQI